MNYNENFFHEKSDVKTLQLCNNEIARNFKKMYILLNVHLFL